MKNSQLINSEKEVLVEDEYVNKLQQLIKKDYFPDLYKYEAQTRDKSQDQEGKQKSQCRGIDQFMAKFMSQDNKSYKQLQNSSSDEFRQKFFWKFKQNQNILAIQSEKQLQKKQIEPDYKKYNKNQFHFAPQLAIKYQDDNDDQIIEPKVIKKQNTRLPKEYLLEQLENQRLQKQKTENNLIVQGGDDDKTNQKKQKRIKKKARQLRNNWETIQGKKQKQARDGLGISKVSQRQTLGLKLQADICRKRQQKSNMLKQQMKSVSRKSVISQSGKQLLQSIRSNRNLNMKTPNIFKKY